MAERPRVFLASRNAGKIAELQRILDQHLPGVQVLGLDDVAPYAEPVEDQPTFEGNALLKARAGAAETGIPSLADDSGLCVAALNGMPGVLSARWAGRSGEPDADAANNRLLLDQLADVPDDRREAHFECALVFVEPAATTNPGAEAVELAVTGRMAGRVIRETRGSGGFGYDALFVPSEYDDPSRPDGGRTSAELTPSEKDEVSHRGRALTQLAPLVAARFGAG